MSEPGWRTVRLRDLCASVDYGLTASATHAPVGPKFLRITDIVPDSVTWKTVPHVAASPEQERRYRLRTGDIVIARTGATTGRSAWIHDPPPAVFASYLIRLALTEDVDSRFLGYVLRSPQFLNYVAGVTGDKSAQPNASATTLTDATLRIPERRDQQRAIAEVLGALDDRIAADRALAEKAEELARALADRRRWPDRVPLRELVEHTTTVTSPTAIPAPRVAHYSLPAFDHARFPEITAPGSIRSAKLVIPDRAVLVSKLNPATPRVWYVEPDPTLPALASTEFLVLTPSSGCSLEEIWVVCGQPEFTRTLAGKATGTSNSHQRVRPADLLATDVVDPRRLSALTRDRIRTLFTQATQARQETRLLAELRDTLLPPLTSGRIHVRDTHTLAQPSGAPS